jgi:hypothetical protein
MTIDSGVQGHAPSVLIRPLREHLTVKKLIAVLQSLPQDALVDAETLEATSVCEARYDLVQHTVYLSGAR